MSCSTEQHQLSSSKLLDGEDGDERCEEILRAIASGEKAAQEAGETNAILKDCCCVVRDNIDAWYRIVSIYI